jgi:hypothetical protein
LAVGGLLATVADKRSLFEAAMAAVGLDAVLAFLRFLLIEPGLPYLLDRDQYYATIPLRGASLWHLPTEVRRRR